MALTFDSLQSDTIAAIATGLSESGIGIIRVSGPEALPIGDRMFRNKNNQRVLLSYAPGTIHFGFIVDPDAQDEIIDEVMVTVMHHPHSYTTEDTVEINTHGGVYLMNRILELALNNGARMAAPGEFTKRAFMGGRIDLARAEAVMDLISSNNEFARKTSIAQLEGSVSKRIRALREKILYEIAFIESALDDPENYSMDGYPDRLSGKCNEIIEELNRIIDFSENGRILKEGIRTVIVGRPNAGKSSLLNYLSGQERAIVTDIPGTTRDTLEESVRLGDLVLNITDTAGIHKTEDTVEKIGVERAVKATERADLILMMLDTSIGIDEEDREIVRLQVRRLREGIRCIVLMNKSDLPSKTSAEEVRNLFRMPGIVPDSAEEGSAEEYKNAGTRTEVEDKKVNITYKNVEFMSISLTTGEGMDYFKNRVAQMFRTGELTAKNEVFLSNVRQKQEAVQALQSLKLVRNSIEQGLSEDFFSIDLMNAYTSLGRILGEAVEDDLVEEIFSRFCLGK